MLDAGLRDVRNQGVLLNGVNADPDALLDLCFGPLGLRRVLASTLEANHASWRVMEKLGMRLESSSRRATLHRDLGWIDGRVYALLADEWAQPTSTAQPRQVRGRPDGLSVRAPTPLAPLTPETAATNC